MNTLKFKRIKQQQFYTASVGGAEVLKSYSTIVGLIDSTNTLYNVKYSRTTSKQVSQYANANNINNRVVCSQSELKQLISDNTGLSLDTTYGGALWY